MYCISVFLCHKCHIIIRSSCFNNFATIFLVIILVATPKIASTDTPITSDYAAVYALTDECESGIALSTNFLLPDKVVNQGFVIDIGYQTGLESIYIKNSKNGDSSNR